MENHNFFHEHKNCTIVYENENAINSTLPIGQYIFWGTITAVLIATIVYRGGFILFWEPSNDDISNYSLLLFGMLFFLKKDIVSQGELLQDYFLFILCIG